MSAHTKGPWNVVRGLGHCSVFGGQREILSYMHSPDAQAIADCHLVAAAPDLLAALLATNHAQTIQEYADAEKMRAVAIAKATGTA